MVKHESQNIAKGTTDLGGGCFNLIECSTQWKTFVQTFVSSSHNLANIYFWNQLWIATHETDIRTKPTHCKVEIFRQSEALQFNSRSRSFIMLPNLGQTLLGLIWQRGEKYIQQLWRKNVITLINTCYNFEYSFTLVFIPCSERVTMIGCGSETKVNSCLNNVKNALLHYGKASLIMTNR